MEHGLPIAVALLIFIVGWIVAVVVAGIVKAIMNKTTIDERFGTFLAGGDAGKAIPIDKWVAGGVKWLIIIFALVMAVDRLGLRAATEPLNDLLGTIMEYLPKIGGAAILLFLAWLIATGLRKITERGLAALGVDDKINKATGEETPNVTISKSVGTAVYWIVFLLFLLMVLNTLELTGLLEPLQVMTTKIVAFLPNLFSALVILALGWFAATIVRRIVGSLLAAVGVDRLADKTGVSKVGKGTISGLLGTVAFLLILLPVITASLDALEMEAVSGPISGLLDTFFQAIPNLLYAAVIITVAVVVGKLVAGLVTDLLARVGFDNVLQKLGLSKTDAASIDEKKRPSAVVGQLVLLAVLLFASMEALDKLGLTDVSTLVNDFIGLDGNWIFGLIIFGLGLWLANLVAGIIKDRGTPSSDILSTAARIGITVLAGIAALDKMGVAEDVVQWGVIVAIGAVGLAFGLAFGLGCKEHASSQLTEWRGKIKDKTGGGA
jgi:hypothetical protein